MPVDLSKLNVAQLEKLIADAAHGRAQLQPAVPDEPTDQVWRIVDPRIQTGMHKYTGGSMMLVRHMALGWIAIDVDPGTRRALVSALLEDMVAHGDTIEMDGNQLRINDSDRRPPVLN